MSLDAYAKRQQATESPRETEYRLFARVTAAMIEARDKGLKGGALMESLDWNRRLWSTLALDCSQPGNQLPEQTRAQIISLSIYVSKTVSKVMRGEAHIDDLISLNRIIMEGLAQQQGGQASASSAAPSDSSPLPQGGVTVA